MCSSIHINQRNKKMKHDILITDHAEQVAIAFENSSGELEYSLYKLVDGGVIGSPAEEADKSAIVASEVNMTDYQDYELHIID